MAIRNIVKEGDPILTKTCRRVENFDGRLWQLLDDMAETLHRANGVGLAAPQVGVLRRAVIVDVGQGVIELINPEIIEKSGQQQEIEGCLSCPDKWGITKRPMRVTVKAQNRQGKTFTVSGEALLAKAFCHEIDHLDGILFLTRMIRKVSLKELEK